MKRRTHKAKDRHGSRSRPRPKFPAISEEMQHWTAMLESEATSWPGVTSKRMFGFRFLYRRKIVFAGLPYSRGLFTAYSIILKFNPIPSVILDKARNEPRLGASAFAPGTKWFSFELASQDDLRDALWWLNQAYQAARKGPAK